MKWWRQTNGAIGNAFQSDIIPWIIFFSSEISQISRHSRLMEPYLICYRLLIGKLSTEYVRHSNKSTHNVLDILFCFPCSSIVSVAGIHNYHHMFIPIWIFHSNHIAIKFILAGLKTAVSQIDHCQWTISIFTTIKLSDFNQWPLTCSSISSFYTYSFIVRTLLPIVFRIQIIWIANFVYSTDSFCCTKSKSGNKSFVRLRWNEQ